MSAKERTDEIRRWQERTNQAVAAQSSPRDSVTGLTPYSPQSRHLFELCYSADSKPSNPAFAEHAIHHRIPKDNDLDTTAGRDYVLERLALVPEGRALIWIFIPCTSVCPIGPAITGAPMNDCSVTSLSSCYMQFLEDIKSSLHGLPIADFGRNQ